MVLTLQVPWTQGEPTMVVGWHVPQTEVAERAQKVDWHCASSPHAPPFAMVPAAGLHIAPKSAWKNLSQAKLASVPVQPFVRATEELVPVAAKLGKQLSTTRALHVAASP